MTDLAVLDAIIGEDYPEVWREIATFLYTGLVEQFENEGGIDNGQFAQFQALGEDHDMGSFGRESVQDCSRPAPLASPGRYFRPREPRPRYTAHPMEQAGERP